MNETLFNAVFYAITDARNRKAEIAAMLEATARRHRHAGRRVEANELMRLRTVVVRWVRGKATREEVLKKLHSFPEDGA